MKRAKRFVVSSGALVAMCAAVLFQPPTSAGIFNYYDKSAFEDDLASYYLEGFDTFVGEYGEYDSPKSFLGGTPTFGYDISAETGKLYIFDISSDNPVLSTVADTASLTVDFTSGNVTAVGFDFFLTNASGQRVSGEISLKLDGIDKETVTIPASGNLPFRGFLVTGGDTFSSVSFGTAANYVTIDNLYVGVPEPGDWALAAGLGLAALAAFRRLRAFRA